MKKNRTGLWIVLAVVGIVLVMCCGVPAIVGVAGDVGAQPTETASVVEPTSTLPAPAPHAPAPSKTPSVPTIGESGTSIIGTDVPAGRYKTDGPVSGSCYWELATGPNIQPGDPGFINNANVEGRAYVRLRAGQYFTTSDCKPWVRVGP